MKTSSFGTQPAMNTGSKFSIRHDKKLGLTDTVKFISDKLEVEEDLIALKAFLVAAYYISKQLPFAIFNDESELLFGFNGSALEGNPELIEAYKEFQAILSGIVDEFSVVNVNKFASLQQQRIKEVIDHLKPQENLSSSPDPEVPSVESDSHVTEEQTSVESVTSEANVIIKVVDPVYDSSPENSISSDIISSEDPSNVEEPPLVEPVSEPLSLHEKPSVEQVVEIPNVNPDPVEVSPPASPIVEMPIPEQVAVAEELPIVDNTPKTSKPAGKELTLLEKILLNSQK